jgi:glycosyltransferase involved in cell wall biosynthesis
VAKPPKKLPNKKKSAKKPARKPTRKTGKPKARPSKPLKRKRVKGRLLWIGDAVAPTGFATVTHAMLQHLRHDWEIVVSGINYGGQPHRHPYRILPAQQGHGDMWGLNHFSSLCAEFAPDVVVINNDWWNVAAFVKRAPKALPLVGYMPVDGANLDPAVLPQLNRLSAAVWYTHFGHGEALKAGFRGARHVIPHGMDIARWSPVSKSLARDLLELPLPANAFVVGNVNRNQPRKRLDVTIQYFAEWVREKNVPTAWLLLHCAKQDIGWDLERLARHHGIANRLILTGGETMHDAADASKLQLIYSALDVQISTALGEGWGLTTMEGMACGAPQIVPDWAALGEWAAPALKVPCSTQLAYPGINTIGALPDKEAFIAALDRLHRDAALRAKLARESVAFVRQPHFAWSEIARRMGEVLTSALHGRNTHAGSRMENKAHS